MSRGFLVVVFAIGMIATTFGQKCKNTTTIDDFTGNKTVKTDKVFLGWSLSANIHLEGVKINDKIRLNFHLTSNNILSIDVGDEILFKTDTGDIITLYSSYSDVSMSVNGGWILFVYVLLDEVSIEELINSNIVKMRVKGSDIYVNIDIKKKKIKYIANTVNCISN